ncbi:MAG TPA: hypothetical protein VLX32_10775 [Candidatus Acidoferrum sp.]|nr:hypothetical protein [Candidatus Acidoferrum sp.]
MAEGSVSGGSSSSKSLMWMTAALFAGMAVLLVGGLFLAGRVVRSYGIRASLGSTTVQTKQGTYRLEREREVGPAVPMYPHASLVVPDDDAAVQAAKDAENGIARVTYESDDSRDFIDKWYQDHLPQGFERHDAETPRTEILMAAGVQDSDIAFGATKNGHTRVVVLSEMTGGTTKISIVRIERPEPADSDPAPPQQP